MPRIARKLGSRGGGQVGTMTTKEGALQSNEAIFVAETQSRSGVFLQEPRNASHFFKQILPEDLFLSLLCLERKRTERSNKRFILVLLDAGDAYKPNRRATVTRGLLDAVNAARRETDLAGWHKQDMILCVIFTELNEGFEGAATRTILQKVKESLSRHLPSEIRKDVYVSVQVFGDDADKQNSNTPANPTFYPEPFSSRRFEEDRTTTQASVSENTATGLCNNPE